MIYEKLKQLRPYLEYAASPDTAYNNEYDPTDKDQGKLHNHCGCVAYVIQKYFGGTIVSMKGHYWNAWGTMKYDLTRSGFLPKYSVSRKVPERKKVNPRFTTFYNRVEWAIHE